MPNNGTKRRTFIQSLISASLLAGYNKRSEASNETLPGAQLPICATCGTQFPETNPAPETCPICQDERQYVGLNGQPWTTLSAVQKHHANDIVQWDDGLYSIRTMPKFGIGQRAFLIQTPQGNLLWDCVSLLDEATIKQVKDLGGVDAIAISHPHYYSSMIEWSRAFGDAPIYLHENDAQWVMRKDGAIKFWSGESRDMFGQLTLIHTGGHFDGFQVLHKPGTLFAGDQPQVCMDRQWVSFMYSYPNYIPLSKRQIEHIVNKLAPLDFDQLYGAFPHQNIQRGAKEIVARSAERYIQSIA